MIFPLFVCQFSLYGAHFPLSIDERAGFRPAVRHFLNKVYKGGANAALSPPVCKIPSSAKNRCPLCTEQPAQI